MEGQPKSGINSIKAKLAQRIDDSYNTVTRPIVTGISIATFEQGNNHTPLIQEPAHIVDLPAESELMRGPEHDRSDIQVIKMNMHGNIRDGKTARQVEHIYRRHEVPDPDGEIKEKRDQSERIKIVVAAHGWVCGHKVIQEGDKTVELNYFDLIAPKVDPSVLWYTLEPFGYGYAPEGNNPYLPPDQIDLLDIYNYTYVSERVLRHIIRTVKADYPGKEIDVVEYGHSYGGYEVVQKKNKFLRWMKGHDVKYKAIASTPALRMRDYLHPVVHTKQINKWLHSLHDPRDLRQYRDQRLANEVKNRGTDFIMNDLVGGLMKLRPDDPFMRLASRMTPMSTLVENLQDLCALNIPDEIQQALCEPDWVERVYIAEDDRLVNNKALIGLDKSIVFSGLGHVLERYEAFAQFAARDIETILGVQKEAVQEFAIV